MGPVFFLGSLYVLVTYLRGPAADGARLLAGVVVRASYLP